MTDAFTDDDRGKQVVDARGRDVGTVEEIRDGTAYVVPDDDLAEEARTELGWDDLDEDALPLQTEHVEASTDDRLRLPHFH